MENPYEREDRQFRKFRRTNPGASFAQYSMSRVMEFISNGREFKASSALALAHANPSEFWNAAEQKAKKWFKVMSLRPDHRVIEYGCGSLRLGAHFIRRLDRGNYFGLDVIDGFFDLGVNAMGRDLFEIKAPQLRVIDDDAIAAGQEFAADIVFSNLVCVHVHPDEIDAYFRNLSRLTCKPGARLIFNAMISGGVHRFTYNSWTQPIEIITRSLRDMDMVRSDIYDPKTADGVEMTPIEFEFRRATAP